VHRHLSASSDGTLRYRVGPLSLEVKQRKQGAKRARLEKKRENETRPQEVGPEIGRHRLSSPFRSSQLPIYNAQRMKLARWLLEYGCLSHPYIRSCSFQMDRLVKALRKPEILYRFVINPHSFGQSVENLFYLSFLVKDGLCAVEPDPRRGGVLTICPFKHLSNPVVTNHVHRSH